MRTRLTLLLLLGLLTGCTPSDNTYTADATAFGYPLELTLRDQPTTEAEKAARTAISDLQFIAEVSHPWKPGPLGRTNQLFTFGSDFSANPSILPLLRKATEMERMTEGYYAPALGKLQQLWGFHADAPDGTVPPPAAIDAVLAASPAMTDIHIEGIRMRANNPALRVDFGALARGFAIDTAMLRLREHGIRQARLRNGNAVSVLGEGWVATLANAEDIQVPLHDGESLITLDADEHSFSADGQRYHPYINPVDGKPSKGLRLVSVIHHEAATAAALAQALLAAGEGKLAELLAVIPVDYAMVLTRDNRQITTEAMAQRLATVR